MSTYVVDEGNPVPATDLQRVVGKTLLFNGTDQFVYKTLLTSASGITGFPFTLMAWFRPNNVTQTATIISLGLDDTNFCEIRMAATLPGVRRGPYSGTTSLRPLTANAWAHIAVAFTSSTDAKIYVDGAYLETITTTSLAWDEYEEIRIGCGTPSSGFEDSFFAGRIYDARFYKREMTASEVNQIYRATRRPGQSVETKYFLPDLSAHYWLNTVSDTGSIYDYTAGENHAGVIGATESDSTDLPMAIENEMGFSLIVGKRIPATDYNFNIDATTGALQYPGPLARQAALIQSPCGTVTTGTVLTISGLAGTETVTSVGGTIAGDITIGAGQITFTSNGTIWDLQLNNGNRYVFSEGDGLTVHNVTANANHATVSGTTSAALWAATQDDFHYNINFGFKE